MPLQYYIGTSGWHYEHWRGRFYPEKLTKAKWLEFYAGHSYYRVEEHSPTKEIIVSLLKIEGGEAGKSLQTSSTRYRWDAVR